MSHLPRNGQYELFNFRGQIHCFDDLELGTVAVSQEMLDWLHSLPTTECRPFSGDAAFYLTPRAYLMWKLKWFRG